MKIRYYVTRRAWANSKATWGYWVPTKKMRAAGFRIVRCGEDGPLAWAIAEQWNARWDAIKKQIDKGETPSIKPGKIEKVYPPGSLGDALAAYRATGTWRDRKPRTHEDWERAWKYIAPVFGDVAPATVGFAEIDAWYSQLREHIGIRESQRAMKIWRALWVVAAAMKLCVRDEDPSILIRVKQPIPRSAIWYEGEAVRLVKQAWRMGYRGLATALAVAWDTMLSPIDVSRLTSAQLTEDGDGFLFAIDRAKTGKPAIGTLSRRTARLYKAYIASLPFELHPQTPIFHTRGTLSGQPGRPRVPVPYSRPMMGDDFRAVRSKVFPGDKRQIMDFRRSGAVEATAGEVDPGALAGKMANTIDQSKQLQATYQPHNATLVRLADAARTLGRGRLRSKKE